MEGICQRDHLTGSDQVIPDCAVKVTFLGGDEIAIRIGSKSWFADLGLRTRDSIVDLLSLL